MTDFAILSPGQGGQAPDMFDLVLRDERGRAVVDVFSEAARIDLPGRARAGDRLFENAFAQPALVAVAVATWALLADLVPPPLLFVGYSVGEVSAWACAGAWETASAARVVVERARLMDAASPPGCGMLAIRGVRRGELAPLTDGLQLAIVNDFDHVVLAGRRIELEAAEARLAAIGADTRRIDVAVPSHTSLLDSAAIALERLLAGMPVRPTSAMVLRGVDGRACLRSTDAAAALGQAVSHTIRWDLCQTQLLEAGARVTLELGPGRALTRLSGLDPRVVVSRSVADFRSVEGVATWLERALDS